MNGPIRIALVTAWLASWTAPVHAITPEQKAAVRELVKDGGELSQRGKFAEARDRFMAALEIAKVPAVALYAARAHESLRDLRNAANLYRLAVEMPLDESLWDNDKGKSEFQLRSRDLARISLQQLLERNSTIKIQLVGRTEGKYQITLDGTTLEDGELSQETPVQSGSHVIAVVRNRGRLSQSVNLERAEHKTVTFDLTPADEPEPIPMAPAAVPPLGDGEGVTAANTVPSRAHQPMDVSRAGAHTYLTWSAYGVGAVGLATGIVAGIVALNKRTQLVDAGCSSSGICPRDGQVGTDQINSYNSWRTISTVGFVVGGVATAAGVTLTLTRPKVAASPRISLRLEPAQGTVLGTFW